MPNFEEVNDQVDSGYSHPARRLKLLMLYGT
jgi:hypothetical protein